MFNIDVDIFIKLGIFLAGLGVTLIGLGRLTDSLLALWKERKVQHFRVSYNQ